MARQVVWLQGITLAWMLIECGVSFYGAISAHSPALLAFGSDGFVELLSATVVLLAVVPSFPLTKDRSARLAGILLFVLAGVVALVTFLAFVSGVTPETSCSGMVITFAALVVMPVLAWAKRKTARLTNNRALAADAVQSATCAYLAAMTLAGLAINAMWHIHGWIQPQRFLRCPSWSSRDGGLYAVRAVVAAEILDSSTDSKILQPLSSPP